jgi:UDP:flavonoid glycosyltransferase YjiC (YdhE family)
MNILVAMWDGGGTVPPELAIVKALVQRGHDVRVIGDAVLAEEVAATGASHTPWVTAPQHHSRLPEDDFLRDWELTSMPKVFARVRDRLFCGPAALFAADVLDELGSRPAEGWSPARTC